MRGAIAGFLNPKTFWLGVIGLVTAILNGIAAPLVDHDPETVVNMTQVVNGVVLALGLIFARDADKTSEDSRSV